jgi:hypothetical protein
MRLCFLSYRLSNATYGSYQALICESTVLLYLYCYVPYCDCMYCKVFKHPDLKKSFEWDANDLNDQPRRYYGSCQTFGPHLTGQHRIYMLKHVSVVGYSFTYTECARRLLIEPYRNEISRNKEAENATFRQFGCNCRRKHAI